MCWKTICLAIVLAFWSLVIYQDNAIAANKTTSKELPSDFGEQVEMMGYGNECLNYINRTYGTNKTIKTYIDKTVKEYIEAGKDNREKIKDGVLRYY